MGNRMVKVLWPPNVRRGPPAGGSCGESAHKPLGGGWGARELRFGPTTKAMIGLKDGREGY
jgi:hypothetical protein